jgi:predicted AAA+ superfamily ATPase
MSQSRNLSVGLNINFEDLRKQKLILLETMGKMIDRDQAEQLEGIISILDEIQDQATDNYDFPATEVYGNLNEVV